MDNRASAGAVQRLLSRSSALRNFHDVNVVFIVPASELELKARVHIKIMYSSLVEATFLVNLGPLEILIRLIMHSVKLGSLVFAITVLRYVSWQ